MYVPFTESQSADLHLATALEGRFVIYSGIQTLSSYLFVSLHGNIQLQSRYFCVGPRICNPIREQQFLGIRAQVEFQSTPLFE